MDKLTGVWVPIVTPLKDGEVDVESLVELCEWHADNGAAGMVACGSTGEVASLRADEYALVVQTVAEHSDQVVAGVVEVSTEAAVKRAELASQCGADAVLVIAPPLLGVTGPEVENHYRSVVSDQKLPVYIYNFPSRSGVTLTAEQVLRLAEDPRIRGIKESVTTIDQTVQDVVLGAPVGFSTVMGNAEVFWPGIALGCSGGILAAANVYLPELLRIWDAATNGDLERARLEHRRLWPQVRNMRGVAHIKAILKAKSIISSDEVRRPLSAMSTDA